MDTSAACRARVAVIGPGGLRSQGPAAGSRRPSRSILRFQVGRSVEIHRPGKKGSRRTAERKSRLIEASSRPSKGTVRT